MNSCAPALLSLLLFLTGIPHTRAQQNEAALSKSGGGSFQALVDSTVAAALEKFAGKKLQSNQLALTCIDLRAADKPVQASYRGDAPIYPASVVKLFYLVAAHRWLEDGKIKDTEELRRAMRDMIVDSGNDPTHYIVDLPDRHDRWTRIARGRDESMDGQAECGESLLRIARLQKD